MNLYSEFEPSAAEWLDNLQRARLIPHGYVDRRDIRELQGVDCDGYTQYHFFAGIGGWPEALRLAGWPADCPVWTGSCPCQPFSAAGKREGEADERHLWPEFARLIGECRPGVIFGEQVASRDGREWLARVRLELERMGYAVGAADICAAGVGAPHIRQRLYFGAIRLADAYSHGLQAGREAAEAVGYWRTADATGRARGFGLGNAYHEGLARPTSLGSYDVSQLAPAQRASPWADAEWIDCRDGKRRRVKSGIPLLADGLPRDVAAALSGFGNAIVPPLAAQFIRAFVEAAQCLEQPSLTLRPGPRAI